MFLFLDTETTGLPKKWSDNPKEWPRIIQLAWRLHDTSGKLLFKASSLIKPDGWVVPNEKFWIDAGLTQERNEKEGVAIDLVLNEFIYLRKQYKYLVGHNINFDRKILRGEIMRLGNTDEFTNEYLCTMMKGTKHCAIPQVGRGGLKWPTLSELHMKLFGTEAQEMHDAGNDLEITAKCFFEMLRLGIITLN